MKQSKFGGIGHSLRRERTNIARQALEGNPKQVRPKNIGRRIAVKEAEGEGKT